MAGENSFFIGAVLVCLFAGGGIWLHRKQRNFRFPTLHRPFADHVVNTNCPHVKPLLPGSCEEFGKQCLRVSMPSHISDPEFDMLSVSDRIKMSVGVSFGEDTGSLDITADAAVMNLLKIEWREIQKGFISGKRRMSLSLSLKEPWNEDCHFDVRASLKVRTQFSYLQVKNAELAINRLALARDLQIKASGSARVSVTAYGTASSREKLELTASGSSVVDVQEVPVDYVTAKVRGGGFVTLMANKQVAAECSDLAHIGVLGKALVSEVKEGDCSISYGWISWVKGYLKRVVLFFEKVAVYGLLGALAVLASAAYCCNCGKTALLRGVQLIIIFALVIWLFMLSSNRLL